MTAAQVRSGTRYLGARIANSETVPPHLKHGNDDLFTRHAPEVRICGAMVTRSGDGLTFLPELQ